MSTDETKTGNDAATTAPAKDAASSEKDAAASANDEKKDAPPSIKENPSTNSATTEKSENSVASQSSNQAPTMDAWMDEVLRRFGAILVNPEIHLAHLMPIAEINAILNAVTPVLMEEGSLAECDVPCKVVGDIHGQFVHMNQLFDIIGRVPEQRMMFLGDYVDRGPHSVEVVLYLFCLKLRYRDRIFLLRGNHETPTVNKIYGFYAELYNKFGYAGIGLWWDFQSVFNRLPLAGLIGKKVLCMHGGLSPELQSLDTIRSIIRPCEPLDRGLLIDLLWADPTNKGEGWYHSIRGISYMFGKGVVAQMTQLLGVDLIIRAHQVVQDGYEFMAGRQLITVFSAPNYCNQFSNAAAVVCIDGELRVSFQQMSVPLPEGSKAKPAPVVAADVAEQAQKKTPPSKTGGSARQMSTPKQSQPTPERKDTPVPAAPATST